jgi:hypothetical protein
VIYATALGQPFWRLAQLECGGSRDRCRWDDRYAGLRRHHHHQYETILRGILADGVLGSPGDGKKTYQG